VYLSTAQQPYKLPPAINAVVTRMEMVKEAGTQYPSDSVEAALIREKLYVVPSEDHDQMEKEASDSEEAPCPSSDSDGEADSTDGEGAGATKQKSSINRVAYKRSVATGEETS